MKSEPLNHVTPDRLIESLGPALRLLRGRRRLRQNQVAQKAGMTNGMLSSYETGRTTPSLLSLSTLLVALSTDFYELQEALDMVAGLGSQSAEDRERPETKLGGHSLEEGEAEPLGGVKPGWLIEPLGPALRLLRDRRQLRQWRVAEKAGMTKAMLSSYENGSTTPSLLSLSSLLVALKTDLHGFQEALEAVTGGVGRPHAREDRETRGQLGDDWRAKADSNLPLLRSIALELLTLFRETDEVAETSGAGSASASRGGVGARAPLPPRTPASANRPHG